VSAQQQAGSTITVRVATVAAQRVMVVVADNGVGFAEAPSLIEWLATALGIARRDVIAAVEPAQGCAFELYFDVVE
jgi:hypothetical protein